jgi:starch phosphorylase
MRESMARLTPRFSASRTVREYTELHYLPAATAYRLRSADGGAPGRHIVDWRHGLEEKWALLQFGEVKIETRGGQHVFDVQVFLADIDPKAVRVELFADGRNGSGSVRKEMTRVFPLPGSSGGCVYTAAVSAARPQADYTARILPQQGGVAVPLEAAQILWQR